jgi:hypothetical protein
MTLKFRPETRSVAGEAVILSCWKDVARYLGKGVRTVQRWEHTFDLPVRRASEGGKSAIITTTAEIDKWIETRKARSEAKDFPARHLQELLERIAYLEAENADLRRLLDLERLRVVRSPVAK